MANWLQKITSSGVSSTSASGQKANLPAKKVQGQVGAVRPSVAAPQQQLPNATVIYGMAASALITVALYFLFTGRWFTGFLVLLPAACFLGFALQLLKAK